MLYLDAAATREALGMAAAIEAMRHAFTGEAETPLRTLVGGSLVMPGRLDDHTAVKVVSIVPGKPSGLVAVFGPDGEPLGLVDGPTLTAIRTGAVCGLATDILATDGASTMAMIGAGAMAFDQVEAIRAVRPLSRVLVWSRSPERARAFADRIGGVASSSADEAVAEADIVSCATPAREPLFSAESVAGRTHFNAVGAFTPEMIELPGDLVRRAFVVVDDFEAAAIEAGDLIQAGKTPDADLRQIILDNDHPPDLTVFKSVGVAAQDVAAGLRALQEAGGRGIGVRLS